MRVDGWDEGVDRTMEQSGGDDVCVTPARNGEPGRSDALAAMAVTSRARAEGRMSIGGMHEADTDAVSLAAAGFRPGRMFCVHGMRLWDRISLTLA